MPTVMKKFRDILRWNPFDKARKRSSKALGWEDKDTSTLEEFKVKEEEFDCPEDLPKDLPKDIPKDLPESNRAPPAPEEKNAEERVKGLFQEGDFAKLVAYASQVGDRCDYHAFLGQLLPSHPSGALTLAKAVGSMEPSQLNLSEEFFLIYSESGSKAQGRLQTSMYVSALKVLVENIRDLVRAEQFAEQVNKRAVWKKLGEAQRLEGNHVKATVSFIKAKAKHHYLHKDVIANLTWRQDVAAGRGLHSHRNTCFLNAVLQCLAYLPPFAQHVIENPKTPETALMTMVGGIIKKILRLDGGTKRRGAFYPQELAGHLKTLGLVEDSYVKGHYHDAHEFLVMLVDRLGEQSTRQAPTEMEEIFGGIVQNEVDCRCGYQSRRHDGLQYLTLRVGGGSQSVEEALRGFLAAELPNGYMCPKCYNFNVAKKKISIFHAPNALVVTMNRLTVHGTGNIRINFGDELHVPVSGPGGSVIYDLTGVIEYQQKGGGHYVAFTRTSEGTWFQANDSIVTEVPFTSPRGIEPGHKLYDKKAVTSCRAYMLFYALRPSVMSVEEEEDDEEEGKDYEEEEKDAKEEEDETNYEVEVDTCFGLWGDFRSWVAERVASLKAAWEACMPPGGGY